MVICFYPYHYPTPPRAILQVPPFVARSDDWAHTLTRRRAGGGFEALSGKTKAGRVGMQNHLILLKFLASTRHVHRFQIIPRDKIILPSHYLDQGRGAHELLKHGQRRKGLSPIGIVEFMDRPLRTQDAPYVPSAEMPEMPGYYSLEGDHFVRTWAQRCQASYLESSW